MKKNRPRTGANRNLASTRALAAELGVSHVAVSKYLKHPDWPFGQLPISTNLVPAIRAWAESSLRSANEEGNSVQRDIKKLGLKAQVDIKDKLASAAIKEFNLQLLKGQYHRVDECELRMVGKIEDAKRQLLAVAAGLPFADDVKELVGKRINAALLALHS